MLLLDHIVLGVPDLQNAIQFFKKSLKVEPVIGGKHTGLGTHNALLGIGSPANRIYLELLAINPEDQTHYDNYPLGLTKNLDRIRVLSWCLRCGPQDELEKINHAMRQFGAVYDHGEVRAGHRITPSGAKLSWKIAANSQCIINSSGQVPFLIQWDNMALHPATQFASEDFLPFEFKLSGSKSAELNNYLQQLGFAKPVEMSFANGSKAEIILKLRHAGEIFTFQQNCLF